MGTVLFYTFILLVIVMIVLIPCTSKRKPEKEALDDEEEIDEEEDHVGDILFDDVVYDEISPFEARFGIVQAFVADNASYTTIGVPYVLSYFNYSDTHDAVEKLIIAAESTHYFSHDSSKLLEAIEHVSSELMRLQPMGIHASFEFINPSDTRYSFVVHILRIK